jgi:hypothetical protein
VGGSADLSHANDVSHDASDFANKTRCCSPTARGRDGQRGLKLPTNSKMFHFPNRLCV